MINRLFALIMSLMFTFMGGSADTSMTNIEPESSYSAETQQLNRVSTVSVEEQVYSDNENIDIDELFDENDASF